MTTPSGLGIETTTTAVVRNPCVPDPPFKQDFQKLADAFLRRDTLEFDAFREAWKELQFSYIHQARKSIEPVGEFYDVLFNGFLDNARGHGPMSARLVGLYGLYLLYETQALEKEKISLSLSVYQDLLNLCVEAKRDHIVSPGAILTRLRDSGGLCFTAGGRVLTHLSSIPVNSLLAQGAGVPLRQGMLTEDRVKQVVDTKDIVPALRRYLENKSFAPPESEESDTQPLGIVDPDFPAKLEALGARFLRERQAQGGAREMVLTGPGSEPSTPIVSESGGPKSRQRTDAAAQLTTARSGNTVGSRPGFTSSPSVEAVDRSVGATVTTTTTVESGRPLFPPTPASALSRRIPEEERDRRTPARTNAEIAPVSTQTTRVSESTTTSVRLRGRPPKAPPAPAPATAVSVSGIAGESGSMAAIVGGSNAEPLSGALQPAVQSRMGQAKGRLGGASLRGPLTLSARAPELLSARGPKLARSAVAGRARRVPAAPPVSGLSGGRTGGVSAESKITRLAEQRNKRKMRAREARRVKRQREATLIPGRETDAANEAAHAMLQKKGVEKTSTVGTAAAAATDIDWDRELTQALDDGGREPDQRGEEEFAGNADARDSIGGREITSERNQGDAMQTEPNA